MNFAFGESWHRSLPANGSCWKVIPAFAGMTHREELTASTTRANGTGPPCRLLPEHLDDRGEIEAAIAGVLEGLIQRHRVGAHRHAGIGAARRLHRELEILEHQSGREAALIAVV